MRIKKVLFYFIAGILGGCIPVMSLHSFYTDSDIIFDQTLLGTWVDDANAPETTWQFTRADDPNTSYELIFTDEQGHKGSFTTNLIELEDTLFLDVFPSELPWEPEDPNNVEFIYNSFFLIPAHTILRVDSIEPQLIMRLTDEDDMNELLEENPGAIEHSFVGDRIVITASTTELQAFIIKYANDQRLFPGKVELIRR